MTADLGHGKESISICLMDSGIGSMLIMPEHILRAHPFVGKSLLDPYCYDMEEDDEEMNDAVTPPPIGNANSANTSEPEGQEAPSPLSRHIMAEDGLLLLMNPQT